VTDRQVAPSASLGLNSGFSLTPLTAQIHENYSFVIKQLNFNHLGSILNADNNINIEIAA
jgi:hypothetical protein